MNSSDMQQFQCSDDERIQKFLTDSHALYQHMHLEKLGDIDRIGWEMHTDDIISDAKKLTHVYVRCPVCGVLSIHCRKAERHSDSIGAFDYACLECEHCGSLFKTDPFIYQSAKPSSFKAPTTPEMIDDCYFVDSVEDIAPFKTSILNQNKLSYFNKYPKMRSLYASMKLGLAFSIAVFVCTIAYMLSFNDTAIWKTESIVLVILSLIMIAVSLGIMGAINIHRQYYIKCRGRVYQVPRDSQ